MEASVAFELCVQLHYSSWYNIYIEKICFDDDIAMRAHLMHASGGNIEKLPKHAPTPIFFAIDEFMEKAKASIEHLFNFYE